MAKDIILAAGFVASGVGATGLTVTVDVWRVTLSNLSASEIVTAGSATEIGDGLYAYRVASADLVTYYYYAVFKTSGTADVKHLFGAQLDFSGNTGDTFSRIGAPAGASIAADIASVQSDTDNIQTRIPAALVSGRIDASVGAMAADTLTASALATDAVTEMQNGLATASALSTVSTNVSTLLSRLGAFTGSGLNTVLGFLRAMARKDAALTPSDMAGTFDNTTDSLEAIKDAGASATISDSDMTTIAGRVWNNTYAPTRTLTQSAASVTAAVTGSDIAILRGDTVTIALTGLGSLTGRSALYFTIKSNLSGADSAALLQVSEAGGLLYLNGDAAGTASDASLTVTDASAGNISIVLKPAATKLLDAADGLRYDVQMVTGAGVVTTLTEGDASVSADVTRAVA